MRGRYLAVLAAALLTAGALSGCGGDGEMDAASHSVYPSASAMISDHPEPSVSNDAMEGGGAGGTNDTDNDGKPDASPDAGHQETGDGPLDDLGDAAGDLLEGAGDAVEDVGDAAGKAANRAGQAMK